MLRKCDNSKKRYDNEVVQKERLEKIIEICTLNKDANEEWIRQLNYFIVNMTKMSQKCEDKILKA